MAVTLTTASQRDAVQERSRRYVLATNDLALAATSVVTIVLLAAAYAGSVRAGRLAGPDASFVVNLNTVGDVSALERVFEPVLSAAGDRRLAARELLGYLVQGDGQRRTVANVGAIASVRISDQTIERTRLALTYRERLQEERARAKAAGREPPDSISLVTAAQLTQVKPFLVVRDRSDMRASLILWAVWYLVAFHAVAVVWRARGVPGDRLLLAAAHVLTALGFGAMISRPDALRDTLLFVR
jgi:hypothetical protein